MKRKARCSGKIRDSFVEIRNRGEREYGICNVAFICIVFIEYFASLSSILNIFLRIFYLMISSAPSAPSASSELHYIQRIIMLDCRLSYVN